MFSNRVHGECGDGVCGPILRKPQLKPQLVVLGKRESFDPLGLSRIVGDGHGAPKGV